MSSMKTRDEMVSEITRQLRYSSAYAVVFSQVVADKAGIHPTDNECIDFLLLNGPSTAGQLAQVTGLTTGAVTAVVDRLERAGYVRREQSKADRRKVIVVPITERIDADIVPYAMHMGEALYRVLEQFSDEELDIVMKFMAQANAAAAEVITAVRATK